MLLGLNMTKAELDDMTTGNPKAKRKNMETELPAHSFIIVEVRRVKVPVRH